MGWIDNLKERAFKVFFKEEAKKIELLEQKYEELKSDKELSGVYSDLTSDYDILEEKFLETLNELNEYKQINNILTDELKWYRENGISHNEEKEIDDSKEHIITKDLYLEDGSFIGKGTSFLIEGFEDGKYKVNFEYNSNNIYNSERGNQYFFEANELMSFSKEGERSIHEVRYENSINIEAERITIKDLNLEDGSFIKKGRSFFVEDFENGVCNVHFSNNPKNKYNNDLGDNYLFNLKEVSDFSVETLDFYIKDITKDDLDNILDLEPKEFDNLVEKLISENDKEFMEKRNLNISSYTQEYLNQAKEHDFEKEDFKSFHSYLDREIMGIMELEYDRYNEETYMERYEDTVLGEKKHIDSYEKSNVVDNGVPYLKNNNKNIGIELDIFKSKNNELEME